MRYQISLFLTLITLIGCTESKQSTIPITNALLEGKWILDSTSVPMPLSEDLFFNRGKMYRCNFFRDGYFIDSATFDQASIHSFFDKAYELTLLDTNELMVLSRIKYYYKKVKADDLQASISSYRIGDRFRKDYIGFWKPVNQVASRVEILNTPGAFESVSFEIFKNGSAAFYIDQNTKNAVQHAFCVKDSMPQFSNGCLIGNYGATWNKSRTQLGMQFSRFNPDDTIWFEKVSRY